MASALRGGVKSSFPIALIVRHVAGFRRAPVQIKKRGLMLLGGLVGGTCAKPAQPAMASAHRIKSSFPIALMCTTRRRIPTSASTNPGSKKRGVMLLGGLVQHSEAGSYLRLIDFYITHL